MSALAWFCREHGERFGRNDPHIAPVLAGIRRNHARPPVQKEAVLPEDLKTMLATLDLSDLRGLRDRAILLIGFAGGLRRSEIVGLDCGHGPLFRRVIGPKAVGPDRLTDKHVARLVKTAVLAAGVRGDLSEQERAQKFSGHSLRAGLASSAEVDERYVQKQLGHASAEMTWRYQRRRDRFRVNLTKAAGL
jgi:integrase